MFSPSYYKRPRTTRRETWEDKSFVPLKTPISPTLGPTFPSRHRSSRSSTDEISNASLEKSDQLQHDSTLTALAQLGALQLDCQRSFISLSDHENQYILAEASRSVSLDCPKQCRTGDGLYLGAQIVDLAWGMNYLSFIILPKVQKTSILTILQVFARIPFMSSRLTTIA